MVVIVLVMLARSFLAADTFAEKIACIIINFLLTDSTLLITIT